MLTSDTSGRGPTADAIFAARAGEGVDSAHDPQREGDPYRDLWREVLIRAVFDLHAPHQQVDRLESEHDWLRLRKRRRQLAGWFEVDDDSPGSFAWICDAIGYEPDDVRRILAAQLEHGSVTIDSIRGWRVGHPVQPAPKKTSKRRRS
jgi:hypothetical protein